MPLPACCDDRILVNIAGHGGEVAAAGRGDDDRQRAQGDQRVVHGVREHVARQLGTRVARPDRHLRQLHLLDGRGQRRHEAAGRDSGMSPGSRWVRYIGLGASRRHYAVTIISPTG